MAEQRCQCTEPSVETSVEGLSAISYCSKCGQQLVVTSHFEPIDADQGSYSLFLTSQPGCSVDQLKAIAKVANVNLIQAKQLVSEQRTMIFEGRASEVQRRRRALTAAGVEFGIEPEFRYDLGVQSDTIFFG